MSRSETLFIDVDCAQKCKTGQQICGDAFASKRIEEQERLIAVLSDGLGSGVKANILASMTATMALKFVSADFNFTRAAEVIMNSLPICQVRKISYATFSIADCTLEGRARIVEEGNPPFILLRDGIDFPTVPETIASKNFENRKMRVTEVRLHPEDRLIFYSDGVTQSGMGNPLHRFGWQRDGLLSFVQDVVLKCPDISASKLAHAVVDAAARNEENLMPKDDISCCVLYFRRPRRLMVLSGPPYSRDSDASAARTFIEYKGKKAICGGTTANFVARELNKEIKMDLKAPRTHLPPVSEMDGVDLVTEGVLTLTQAAEYLEKETTPLPADPAGKLVELFLDSDTIDFLVGTRVNEAHLDPTLPVYLEIRRNIIQRIAESLRTRYLKNVTVTYI